MKKKPARPVHSPRALVSRARQARSRARAPYSRFKVGAALETSGGAVFTGCNIENASYGLTVCAERVALLKALSEGSRRFRALAVVTAARKITPPCGSCRQLLWEYCGNLTVHLANLRGKSETHRLVELLPHPFDQRAM
jgi:cytidine deaminase